MSIKGSLQDKHWVIKALVWVSVTFALTLLSMIIWAVMTDQTSTSALKWLQFLQTIGTFLLPPLILAYLCSREPLRWLSLTSNSASGLSPQSALIAIATILLAIPGINLLSYLNQQMTLPAFLEPLEAIMKQQEEAAAALTERFLKTDNIFGLIINLGLMALLPAMAEELSFRGLLVSPFTRHSALCTLHSALPIWASAILFSAIHLQFYGFVPRMLLGALFGYALVWSGSLYLPMLMHFTNNAVAVLLYYIIYARGIDPETIDAFGTEKTLWVGICSLIISIGTIYALRRSCTTKSASSRISAGN